MRRSVSTPSTSVPLSGLVCSLPAVEHEIIALASAMIPRIITNGWG
ncbi:MAG: hypothetical protein ACYC9U_15595 [Nitrososphaerales archaeon]